jgi:hypothetical protein
MFQKPQYLQISEEDDSSAVPFSSQKFYHPPRETTVQKIIFGISSVRRVPSFASTIELG